MIPQVPDFMKVGRFVGAAFGLGFLGIGLTVLCFLWSMSFSDFHSPPLVFRIFGSIIALLFVAVGGSLAWASLTKKADQGATAWAELMKKAGQDMPPNPSDGIGNAEGQAPPKPVGYVCPKCGASLAKEVEVSPLGDVKCSFCGGWFNIHGKTA